MPYVNQAKQYIQENKSFRSFENECNVPAHLSGEAWSKAAVELNSQPKLYTVRWEIEIEIDAETAEQAAQRALLMMRDKNSTATFFDVIQHEGEHEQDAVQIEVSL